MVGGLDGRYRIEVNALVGAVQTRGLHAESGGRGDAQSGEIVADVGRSGDLGRRGQPCPGRPLQQGVAQRRAVWQGIWRPPGDDFDAAIEAARRVPQPGGDVGEYRGSGLRIS